MAETPRKELEAQIMWSSGGNGFGLCTVAASMLWGMDYPTEEKPDWPSIVTVKGEPDKYTDEELEVLIAFSKRHTAKYDEIFKYRRGANLIVFDKADNGRWLRKRMSWEFGPMYSDTLEEAIQMFK